MGVCKKFMVLLLIFVTGILMFATLATAATVDVKSKEGIGSYLTDEKGMTLYIFKKDSLSKSTCVAAGGCLDRWPIFYTEKIDTPKGLKTEDFGTITREDGKKQTTYKGLPLYYFFKDKASGDIAGQGVGKVWYVVAP